MTEPRPSNLNAPNVLTVLRIIMAPLLVVVLFWQPANQGWRFIAIGIFVVAMLTNLAGGYIARRHNLITDFGKLWDPIADKALTGATFISPSLLGELPWYFTVLILVREWGIMWLRTTTAKYGIMAANRGGKLKAVTQSLALVVFLAWLPGLPGAVQFLAWVLMWTALILTLVTGADYTRGAIRARARGKQPRRPAE